MVKGANHFLNDGPTPDLLAQLERVIALTEAQHPTAPPIPLWSGPEVAEQGLRLAS
jgi:hypothetical protein